MKMKTKYSKNGKFGIIIYLHLYDQVGLVHHCPHVQHSLLLLPKALQKRRWKEVKVFTFVLDQLDFIQNYVREIYALVHTIVYNPGLASKLAQNAFLFAKQSILRLNIEQCGLLLKWSGSLCCNTIYFTC